MTARIVHRPARTTPSAPSIQRHEIERPPEMPEDGGGPNFLMLVPMLGAGASMTIMMLFRGSGLAAVGAMMMLLTVLAFVIMMFSQRGKIGQRRRMLRDRYLTYLDRKSAELSAEEAERLAASYRADPHPGALLSVIRSRHRLWERRRDDSDFLRLRIGTGDVPAREFYRTGDENAMTINDEFMAAELARVEKRYRTLPDAPVTLDLDGVGNVSVVGDAAFCRRVAMVLTAQAASLTSPEDVQMALSCAPERREWWSWFTWLPHVADQDRPTEHGPERRVAPTVAALSELLRPEMRRRLGIAAELRRNLRGNQLSSALSRLWVVLDQHAVEAEELTLGDRELGTADLGITALYLLSQRADEPDDVGVRITPDPERTEGIVIERYRRRDEKPVVLRARLDEFTVTEAEAITRHLAGLRLSPDSLEHSTAQEVSRAADLLGLDDVRSIDLDALWAPRPRSSFLRVQIGVDDAGEPVMLDLKESAHYGMGPHGLAIGATGSGKSELLRTLVLGLCVGHPPSDVNLVLVDYKGGAAFAPFARLPHVAGVITNLEDDANLIERVYASLEGEIRRRQQLLKSAGDLPDITRYRRRRAETLGTAEELEPMAHLVVIIDEFGELLTARPDFIDLFLSIGRIGRSIGVHLLLSSQRIEGGKLRGLDTYLSYRIGLRTLSEAESRTVLDTPDAFSLPPLPGYGYLKVDTTTYTRFRAGYVSGPLPEEGADTSISSPPGPALIPAYAPMLEHEPDIAVVAAPEADEGEGDSHTETVLGTVLEQLAGEPRRTAPIWLEPIPAAFTLDAITGTPVVSARGIAVPRRRLLAVPVGLLDDPAHQWQGIHEIDLSGGHTLIAGAPRSGKTTVLQTFAVSLALTHTPAEVIVFGLDLVGGALASIGGLPNVAGVATRMDREVVRRTVEEAHEALRAREDLLTRLALPDLAAAREALAMGDERVRAADTSEVVLLIDGIGQISEEFSEIEEPIRDLVRRGAGLGVHVVATASRVNEVRLNLQTYFTQRLELRLTEPAESVVGRKLAETLRADRPGQFLVESGLFGQIALPRMDAVADQMTIAAGMAATVRLIAEESADRAPGVRLLPQRVVHADLEPAPLEAPSLVPFGLREKDLGTELLDLDGVDRNLVLLGDGGTGRTSTLRYLAQQLIAAYSSDEIVFAVVDPRRVLGDVVPEDYMGAYAPSTMLAERLAAAILPELESRVPSAVGVVPGETPQPRIVLLVDDYDVLTAGGSTPLGALRPYAAMSAEVNLSVILARRVAGASRGIYDPLVAAVRESGATGLMFSGDRTEGQLWGGERPQRLPTGRVLLVRAGDEVKAVQVAYPEPTNTAAGVGDDESEA